MNALSAHRPKVYLAGPECYLPDALDVGMRKKLLCEQYGFAAYVPIAPITQGENRAAPSDRVDPTIAAMGRRRDVPEAVRAQYLANMRALREADLLIANLTPFRGINADVGVAFELGVFAALAKPAFAYAHGHKTVLMRAATAGFMAVQGDPPLAVDGMSIENFDLPDHFMLACACVGDITTPETPERAGAAAVSDFDLFETTLKLAGETVGLMSRRPQGRVQA